MGRRPTLPALEMRCGRAPVFNPAFESKLEAFQSFVGGLVDVINVEPELIAMLDRKFVTKFGARACVVVMDDMHGAELNEFATALAGRPVFGDALFCDVP